MANLNNRLGNQSKPAGEGKVFWIFFYSIKKINYKKIFKNSFQPCVGWAVALSFLSGFKVVGRISLG